MTPTLGELTSTFTRIGLLSFGGPAAQIAMMHREIVDERKWLAEKDYLSALSFCMLLPGPEAMQLATWIGWRTHGTIGGLITGLLFVMPGALVVLLLSMVYAAFGTVPLVAALFTGVQAAVLAVVIEALLRVARRALKGQAQWIIAALAFLALFAFAIPFPVVIIAAGLYGYLTSNGPTGPLPAPERNPNTLKTIAIWGAIWLLPLAALWLFEDGLLFEIGVFFSKLAVVTFGGAYAVLAWMAQAVVQDKEWLTLTQMMDGLGLAETTPGPLILVTEFVGYMAAHKEGGMLYGLAGAMVTLWMTFAPCFLWIFAGAPYIARLTAQPRLAGALSAILAAVVGVIANLSLWFAAHVLFATVNTITATPLHMILPDPTTLRPLAVILALAAGYTLLWRHWSLPLVLVLCALASAAATLF
ncbi:MAG: chromate efflux transporter [Paracoccaceae bacterium]